MGKKSKWTVLTVRIRNKRRVFYHGNSIYRYAPVVPLDYGSKVLVFRKGSLFDEVEVEETPNPHDAGGIFFTGLPKTVPKKVRYYQTQTFPGGTWKLYPSWFMKGDVLRLETSHWEFRGYMFFLHPKRFW